MTGKNLIQSNFLKTRQKAFVEKTERVVTALYLVSSFITDKEPLKWQIREKALETFSYAQKGFKNSTLDNIESIINLVSLANRSALISPMNSELLDKGLRMLTSDISQTETLDDNFFEVRKQIDVSSHLEEVEKYKKDITRGKDIAPIYKGQTKVPKKTFNRKDKRRDKVVEALKRKRDSSIKDIARQVKGCSEKTIQREVNSLIAEGVVTKKGERRWSVYSLG